MIYGAGSDLSLISTKGRDASGRGWQARHRHGEGRPIGSRKFIWGNRDTAQAIAAHGQPRPSARVGYDAMSAVASLAAGSVAWYGPIWRSANA